MAMNLDRFNLDMLGEAISKSSSESTKDAYARIINALRILKRDDLVDANGGIIAKGFSPYLTDASAMEDEARINFIHLRHTYPRHGFMKKGQKVQVTHPIITKYREVEQAQHTAAAARYLTVIQTQEREAFHDINVTNAVANQFGVSRGPLAERSNWPALLINAQSNTHSRSKMEYFEQNCMSLIHECSAALWRWCNQNECEFGLRFPLAFYGPGADYLRSTKVGIPDMDAVMGDGMRAVMDYLASVGLYHLVQRDNLNTPLDEHNRHEYVKWDRITATGMISSPKIKHTLLLTPACMTPALLYPRQIAVPFYSSPSIPTHLIHDQLIFASRVELIELTALPSHDYITEVFAPELNPPTEWIQAGRVMAWLATAITACITSVSTGSGYHKPRFVASGLTPALIDILPIVGKHVLRELKAQVK